MVAESSLELSGPLPSGEKVIHLKTVTTDLAHHHYFEEVTAIVGDTVYEGVSHDGDRLLTLKANTGEILILGKGDYVGYKASFNESPTWIEIIKSSSSEPPIQIAFFV